MSHLAIYSSPSSDAGLHGESPLPHHHQPYYNVSLDPEFDEAYGSSSTSHTPSIDDSDSLHHQDSTASPRAFLSGEMITFAPFSVPHDQTQTLSPLSLNSNSGTLSPTDEPADGAVFMDDLIGHRPSLSNKRAREEDETQDGGPRKSPRSAKTAGRPGTRKSTRGRPSAISHVAAPVEKVASATPEVEIPYEDEQSSSEDDDVYSSEEDDEVHSSDDDFVPGNDDYSTSRGRRTRKTRRGGSSFNGTAAMALQRVSEAHGGEKAREDRGQKRKRADSDSSDGEESSNGELGVNKSSRGRKVPTLQQHMAETTDGIVKRAKAPKTNGGKRTFVCVTEGCGKCFLRSEHLKRHVRSLHTFDKREFPFLVSLIESGLMFPNPSTSMPP